MPRRAEDRGGGPGAKPPVLVVMAKEPGNGRTKTRLSPPLSPIEATALYEALLLDTISLASTVAGTLLAVAVTPPEGIGYFRQRCPPGTLLLPVASGDIGEALSRTFDTLLLFGHRMAVAFNADGPSTPLAYLELAFSRLCLSDVVIGPCADGGYYLIGLREPRPELFTGIPWSTGDVTSRTVARAESLGLRVSLLPPWYDVDTVGDVHRILSDLSSLPGGSLPHTRRFIDGLPPSSPLFSGR